MFIDVDEIDTMNLRTLHELTTTQFNAIQFLQHLKLLPKTPSDENSCKSKCNNWYLAYCVNKGDEGMLIKQMLIKLIVLSL